MFDPHSMELLLMAKWQPVALLVGTAQPKHVFVAHLPGALEAGFGEKNTGYIGGVARPDGTIYT